MDNNVLDNYHDICSLCSFKVKEEVLEWRGTYSYIAQYKIPITIIHLQPDKCTITMGSISLRWASDSAIHLIILNHTKLDRIVEICPYYTFRNISLLYMHNLTHSRPFFLTTGTWILGAQKSVVGWGAIQQARRLRVQSLMRASNFSIYLILPTSLWPWGWHRLKQKWVP